MQFQPHITSNAAPAAPAPPAPPAPAPAPAAESASVEHDAPATPASATRTRTAPPQVDRLPPWRVILHNDDVNAMGHFVESIIDLLHVNPRFALACTLTAHRTGLCHLLSTHREKAELLQDQFKCKALTVTIEPEA